MKILIRMWWPLVAVSLLDTFAAKADVLNDQCASALTVGTAAPAALGSNLPADAANDGAATCQPDSQGDVWFAYSATCSGMVTIDTFGSGQSDTVLSVFSGCGGAEIACNDDAESALWSRVSFSADSGQAFRIRLASVGAAGDYQLNISCLGLPTNDTCAAALAVSDGASAATGNNLLAHTDGAGPGCQEFTTNDVWFAYTATCDGTVTVDTFGSSQSDTVLSVYSACAGPEIACNDDADGSLAARVSFDASIGELYHIRLASAGSPGDYRLNIGCVGIPVNDSCLSASPISDGAPAAAGNNLLASVTSDAEAQCQTLSTGDVWFQYVATCDGLVLVDTLGSAQPDPILSAYAWCAGQELACNDDSDGTLQAALSFTGTLGQSYWIRLASVGAPGPFTINVSCLAVPDNDACATASVVMNGTPAATGNNLLASATDQREAACQPFSDFDVWFTYVSTCDGAVTVDTFGSSQADTILSIYDGCSAGEIACNDDAAGGLQSEVSFATTLGQSYRIRLASVGAPGGYALNVNCLAVPTNDSCASALVVADGVHAAEGNNLLASATDDAEADCQPESAADVWFQYTVSCNGLVIIDTSGSGQADPVLSVYEGCGGTEIACDDDSGGGLQARVTLNAVMGQTVWIRLASVGLGGDYDLNIACVSPPTNESCASAIQVAEGAPAVHGNNLLASANDDREAGCQPESGGDVWFRYVASCTGMATVDTFGSGQSDTVLSAYGSCGGAELACNNDAGDALHSSMSFDVTGGTAYLIRLGSIGEPGEFALNISCLGIPTNDTCATAMTVGLGSPAAVGNNLLAAAVDDAAAACAPGPNHDVWFRFVATCDSAVFVDTLGGTQSDTILSVYDSCGGAELACSDDSGGTLLSALSFEGVLGQSYWIRVGSVDVGGNFVLNIAAPGCGVQIVGANPPMDNPFVSGQQPFRDVVQTGSAAALSEGIGGCPTPGEGPVSYCPINVTFSLPTVMLVGDVAIECTYTGSPPGSTPCPAVTAVSGTGAGPYNITLDRPIPPGGCTKFTFANAAPGQALRYESLPGDINFNGATTGQDLLGLVTGINLGQVDSPADLPRYDINRNGLVTGQDALRLVQLLNGQSTTQPWNGVALTPCP